MPMADEPFREVAHAPLIFLAHYIGSAQYIVSCSVRRVFLISCGHPRYQHWDFANNNLELTRLQGLITFKIFPDLLTLILLSLNIRKGSRRERQRRTVANGQMKTSLLAIEGIPDGGGKPKKASNHAIIAGPPLGSQRASRHQQFCIQQSAISK
jgi:hypothetical protein